MLDYLIAICHDLCAPSLKNDDPVLAAKLIGPRSGQHLIQKTARPKNIHCAKRSVRLQSS
jgi:hypothetical protein